MIPFRLFFLVMCSLLTLSGCGPEEQTVSIQGETMGTTYTIKVVLPKTIDEAELKSEIDRALLDFDHEMSNWNPKSWVTGFNASKSTDWQDLGLHAYEIIAMSQNISKASLGAFDITVSPLIERWGFGAREKMGFPDQATLAKILSQIGAKHLALDHNHKKIKKSIPELSINASAIAKGYGVDVMATMLLERGLQHFMVEIGGEVRCHGKPLHREQWQIGLQSPNREGGMSLHASVPLNGQSLATSGDYRNFFTHEGKTYSHVIDPKSGWPVDHALCSVTVIAPNCALADALATTCLVLGVEQSLAWIKNFEGCELYMIERRDDGELKVSHTEGFKFKRF
jgi:thiamine biosynthesis lipoprotein